VFDALGFLHPGERGPTFLHARDAILCAYEAQVGAGILASDEVVRQAVRDVFGARGLGGDASSKNARFRSAHEGFGPIGNEFRRNCS
jgi:hypothetical protein